MHRQRALHLRDYLTRLWVDGDRNNTPINYLSHDVRLAMEMLLDFVGETREKNIDSFAVAMSMVTTAACMALCDLPRHQCELFGEEAHREIARFEVSMADFFRSYIKQVDSETPHGVSQETKKHTRLKEIEFNKIDLYLTRKWGRSLDELKHPPYGTRSIK